MISDEQDLDVHELHDAATREPPEPRDGNEPAPLWMWIIGALTIAHAFYYFGTYSGDFRVDRMDLTPPSADSVETSGPPTYEDRDPLELGKERFARCASCHQPDGQGVAGRYPPLAGSEWLTADPAIPVRILLHGLDGPIAVLGKNYLGKMPGWGVWTDAEIAGVLTYVRSSFGNSASPIDFEMVRAIREETKDRTGAWTSQELRAIAPSSDLK